MYNPQTADDKQAVTDYEALWNNTEPMELPTHMFKNAIVPNQNTIRLSMQAVPIFTSWTSILENNTTPYGFIKRTIIGILNKHLRDNKAVNRSRDKSRVRFAHFRYLPTRLPLTLSGLRHGMKHPPYGITGFHYYLDETPPSTDESAFIALCHTFKHQINAEIVETLRINGSREKNFTSVTFKTHKETFSILLNGHYPFIAFASRIEHGNPEIDFIDRPQYATLWSKLGAYTTLTVADLTISPHDMELADLSDTEYDQMLIHKPIASGQIVFNYWD